MSAFAHRCGKLSLREFTATDAADIQALHADARVRALLPDAQPLHEPAWAEHFAACLGGFYRRHPGLGIWRCAARSGGLERFAGWFSLMPLQASPGTEALAIQPGDVELGSRLTPAHWGSGLSLSGGEVLLRHAFGSLDRRTVWGICHPDNHSAAACLRALGFTPRGRARYEGQPSDFHALDAPTWARVASLTPRQRLRLQRGGTASPTSPPP
ncbi:GNAT family protein [Roseateles asaccharophilus]|uniref:RimJ/RimL family protein N-acetyltransferase n=1 Tax=Roseateles asaccharophilus TaxID=582607 RepID=A0ABU2ABP3_9BURK|nr:GNAT family protein [Roseateles asaccharophilus]MDR7333408.1 RimJ/RimL family protein N-acetyltransferase [Roseateles asaccharophilus]